MGGIRSTDWRLRGAELSTDDVRALGQCRRFVHRDRPRNALPAEPTIGREDELVLVEVLERCADVGRNLIRCFNLQSAMADHPDRNLLRHVALVWLEGGQER